MSKATLFRFLLGGFLCGISAASFFTLPVWLVWAACATGAVLCMVRSPGRLAAGLFMLAAGLGLWRADGALTRDSVLWGIAADRPEVVAQGFVAGDFELTANGGKYPFRVLVVNGMSVDERIIVYGPDWVRPRFGQALVLTGKLQQPKNSGDFDYISYLARDGIRAQMHFPAYEVPGELPVPWSIRLKRPLIAVRDALGEGITRAVPQPQAGYLGGILLGTRGVIEADLKDAFARTGTSHILAISGYNITIIAAALMAVLTPLGRRRSFWCTVLGIMLFVIMVGASASVVRAGIMGVLALSARHLGRAAHAGTAIMLSAAVMAAHNPLVLRWDVGFQLSFLAVVGIVYLEPLIRQPLKRLTYEPLAVMTATTLAAQVMVLPLILYDFGTLAVYTLPVNLLVLPLVPLAMALALATGVSSLAWAFLGSLVGQLTWLVAAVQLAIIRVFADLPAAAVQVSIGWPLMLALYIGLAVGLFSWYNSAADAH